MSPSSPEAEPGLTVTSSDSKCHLLSSALQQPPRVSVGDFYVCKDVKPLPPLGSWLELPSPFAGPVTSFFSLRGKQCPDNRGAFPLRGARFTTALTSLLPLPFPGLSEFIFGRCRHQQPFLSKQKSLRFRVCSSNSQCLSLSSAGCCRCSPRSRLP